MPIASAAKTHDRSVCLVLVASILVGVTGQASADSSGIVEVRIPYAELPVISKALKLVSDGQFRVEGQEHFLVRIGDVGIDRDGRVLVIDTAQHKVFVFDGSGAFIGAFGKQGEGPGDLTNPSAIAADDVSIYVMDQSRISVFDERMQFVRSFGHGIPGAIATGMVVDIDQNIFISCFEVYSQQVIHKYTNDGKRLTSFCDSYAFGTNEDVRTEQVYAGGAIDIDSDGMICYSQRTPYLIEKFSTMGSLAAVIDRANGFVRPPHVVIKGDSREYYFGTVSSGIGVFRDGTMVNSVVFAQREMGDFEWPTVLDVFSRDGSLIGSVGLSPRSSLFCVDELDRLYLAQYSEEPAVVRYRLVRDERK